MRTLAVAQYSTPHGPHTRDGELCRWGHVVGNAADDGAGQVPESASGPAVVVAAAEVKEEGTEGSINKHDLKQDEVPSKEKGKER